MTKRTLAWFTQDLRLHDNPMLFATHEHGEEVLHVFFVKDYLKPSFMPGLGNASKNKFVFLVEGLLDLKNNLKQYGHDLLVIDAFSLDALPKIISKYKIDIVCRSELHGYDEREIWKTLNLTLSQTQFIECATYTLFNKTDLPFDLAELPDSFSKFRKLVEKNNTQTRKSTLEIVWKKAIPIDSNNKFDFFSSDLELSNQKKFHGGEIAARQHVEKYFTSNLPFTYKQTRNQLLEFDASTKLSPWLAQGSLSVISVLEVLNEYEKQCGANESTYWIYFELLWREYFFWNAYVYGKNLFLKKGRRDYSSLTSFYAEQFMRWVNGTTEWPIVNACMHELADTGFMSNRGRQLVASCLVNELALDWRYGAAYFEQQLIDYDVGSNWGNWQYLAGVGADPRGHRRFDLHKQTRVYDPHCEFINYWQGNKNILSTNTRDAADWPIS